MTEATTLKVPHTDIDAANLFVDKYRRVLHYVHAWKAWVFWNGVQWAKDDDEGVVRRAMTIADDLLTEARRLGSEKGKPYFDASVRLSKGKAIREMLTLGRTLLPKKSEDFDTDPGILNTPLGTVYLNSGGFYANMEYDYLSRMTTIGYDGTPSECPEWQRFLFTVTGGNVNLIDFLQRAVGYSLTGYTKERAAFILYGTGRNGKSTFLRTIQSALGDYATTASSNLIMAGRDEKTYNDLAALRGVRFVAASESARGRAMDSGIFKLITGDEPISARFLYGEWFAFRPQFKLWLATNHRPEADADDEAVWDRIRLVPFTVRIPDADVDDDLGKKLEAELPGILKWAVEGAAIWSRDGLGVAEAVTAATLEYRHDADLLGQWLDECCEISSLSRYRTGSLYESWRQYSKKHAPTLSVGRQSDFTDAMQRKGFERVTTHGNKSYTVGVQLRQADKNDPDDQ